MKASPAETQKEMNPDNKLNITDFLIQAASIPVVDVRSPAEYRKGHIPGAFNIPLFNPLILIHEAENFLGNRYRHAQYFWYFHL